MADVERLTAWMDRNGYSMKRLADELGMSYDGVYQALIVRKRVGEAFRWRFARRFGMDVAERVFAASESIPLPQPS